MYHGILFRLYIHRYKSKKATVHIESAFLTLFIFIASSATAQKTRYQDPISPFSYESEDVNFRNDSDGISIAGTLTYPRDNAPHPAVILLSGSGPQNRNSEILEHRPFLVLSDYLTKNGIAVLRTDDRGAGESGGDHNNSGLRDFASDAKAAIDFLKTRAEIDTAQIGLLGHSLGGIIAPMVAAEKGDIAFLVLLAAPGMRGRELMLLQKEIIERKMGVNELGIAMGQNSIGGAYDIIVDAEINPDSLGMTLRNYFQKTYGGALPKVQLNAMVEQMTFPWFIDFIRYQPEDILKHVKCPVLAINGSNDLQVPARKNLGGIDSIFSKYGNLSVETRQIEGLNHLFQTSETGLPQEYSEIEETFSEDVMDEIARWILKTKNAEGSRN